MAVTSNTFGMQRVFKVKIFDLADGSCLGMLTNLKDSNLSMTGELVYATGGDGNPKLVGFGHSKAAMLTTNNALVDFGVAGAILGSDYIVGVNTNYVYTDVVTVTTNAGVTEFTALGSVGAEIGFAYVQNADGTLGKKLEQAGTASAGKFAYAVGTKALTFFAGDVPTGSKVIVFYNATTSATTRTLLDKSNVFSKEVKVVADGIMKDPCTGTEYGAQVIFHKAQTSNNMELALSADGDPVVMNAEFEALLACNSNDLVEIIVYDPEETV